MSGGARRIVVALCGVGMALGIGGCRNAGGLSPGTRALERAGYRDVDLSVRTGGGIDVVKVAATAPPGAGPDRAAEVLWGTLPVAFDQLVVALRPPATSASYSYEALAVRLGVRDPVLDRRQAGDAVVHRGLELVVVLSLGALLAGAGVVAGTVLVLRGVRGARPAGSPPPRPRGAQAEGPISGLGAGSATADGSGSADDADAMPS